jgi:hypothetical protein
VQRATKQSKTGTFSRFWCSWSPFGVSSQLVWLYAFFLSLSVRFVCSSGDNAAQTFVSLRRNECQIILKYIWTRSSIPQQLQMLRCQFQKSTAKRKLSEQWASTLARLVGYPSSFRVVRFLLWALAENPIPTWTTKRVLLSWLHEHNIAASWSQRYFQNRWKKVNLVRSCGSRWKK